jgi:signal transduction histidine kinase
MDACHCNGLFSRPDKDMMRAILVDWATLSISLFNTLLIIWLGLTVLLNADRRTWGIWLAAGSLLMAGAFFISHTAILGLGLTYVGSGMFFWLLIGSIPAMLMPFAWYVVMLWFAGFWTDNRSALYRRQRPWFLMVLTWLVAGFLLLIILADPLRALFSLAPLKRMILAASIGLLPVAVLVYPFYVLLCISLSLDALRRPGPTTRVMGSLARQRAHPWLVASSFVLLLVSLLIGWVVTWIAVTPRERVDFAVYTEMTARLLRFDLLIGALVAIAILLLGQAVVSYEVFTGKALPRRGLLRHWRWAVVLAAGYALLVGGSVQLQLRPIYSLLLSTVLITFFYALFSWRSYAERERSIEQLRPFVASPRLYDRLTGQAAAAAVAVDLASPFDALCRDLLGCRVAYLAAVGPLAPLAGPPLVYPAGAPAALASLDELNHRFESPQVMFVPLEPGRYGQAMWAVPLWSERGVIGVLLLGEKGDGGFYTQEEIEIARASGERLIDMQASVAMARRLMALQRQRLAESQVVDRQTRRVLHDEVLPLLHTAMLYLNPPGQPGAQAETVDLLAAAHRQISNLLHDMPATAASDVSRLGLLGALKRAVVNELAADFDDVQWEVDTAAPQAARAIPPLTAEVLFYAAREAIRNAARHGRNGSQPLHLRLCASGHDGFHLVIEDNGIGLGGQAPAEERQGQGLVLHSTMMAVVGGSLTSESTPGAFTRIALTLPPSYANNA